MMGDPVQKILHQDNSVLLDLQEQLQEQQKILAESEGCFLSLFENNHVVMLLIEPDTGRIFNANSKACNYYGVRKEIIKTMKITDFNILDEEQVFQEMEKACKEQKNHFSFQHRIAGGEIRDVEVYSGPIKVKGKNLLYSIIIDVTERKRAEAKALEYSKLLEGVMQGVADIIGVYKPDHSIVFYNQAGYNFFNTTVKEVKGKKCYQMLGRDTPCKQCGVRKCLQSKKMEIIEKFIPEINKYMDCRYNPILDEKGEVILVIEQLRDITEQKLAIEALKRSEERYRNLFDLSPDGMGVIRKGKIIITNNKLAKLFGAKDSKEIIGKSIFDFIHQDYVQIARERIKKVMVEGGTNSLKDYKFLKLDGKIIDVEVASAPFNYQGKPALQFVIRDVTERKKHLERAALIQRQRLDTKFPLPEKAQLEIIYLPADIISGDLFHFYKVNDYKVVGLLGDISGKGISAAISNSAIKVMFYEAASLTSEPLEILKYLNEEISEYLGEEYVATCCFSFDFRKQEVKIAGAGIYNFLYYHKGFYCVQEIVKGPFLGMLDTNLFEQKVLNFSKGDKFYFYTDGLEDIFTNKKVMNNFKKCKTISGQKKLLLNILSKNFNIKDDSTWLGLEII
jgi:sigma-B regulation protein RsbU (phosphoserine phosphatase)